MRTVTFKNVYVQARSAVVGPLEKEGPLGSLFDKSYEDAYCGESSFEKAERVLLGDAVDLTLRKREGSSDIDLLVGGDLINQLTSSHYFAKDLEVPFLGMYGACSPPPLVSRYRRCLGRAWIGKAGFGLYQLTCGQLQSDNFAFLTNMAYRRRRRRPRR